MDDFQNQSQDDVNEDIVDNSVSTPENENEENVNENDNQYDGDQEQEQENNSQEDQVVFDEKQQAKVNEIVSSKVAKTHEERRRAEELAAENARLKALVPKPTAPEIPPLPSPDEFYGDADGYNRKLAERDAAVQKRAEFDADQRYRQDQQTQQRREAEYKEAQEKQASINSYAENAKSFGIEQDQMQKDAQAVLQVGIAPVLSDHIVNDPQGALITNYLAKNVLELDLISRMSPMAAAVHIANNIKPNLKGAKKSSSAPAPAKVTGGGGTPDKVPSSIKGATFE